MRISKKQAKELANIINACSVWQSAVTEELAKPKHDGKKVREYMGYHDDYARQLNELLGTTALHTYAREV